VERNAAVDAARTGAGLTRRIIHLSKTIRIAVLNSHPIQYFAPLYAYLNRGADLQVTVLYCSDFSLRDGMDPGFQRPVTWDVDLLSGYPFIFVDKRARERIPRGFWSLVCPGVWSEIRSGKYDAVWLHGYNYAANIVAWVAAKTKGLPVLMRCETHLGLHRTAFRQLIRDRALSIAYRFIDAFLAIGTANRDYYRTVGVSSDKIFDVPYTVDNHRFIAGAQAAVHARTTIRSKYGLCADKPVILYASKFMRRKHPDAVIRAVAKVQSNGRAASLLMVGTGELEGELRALVQSLTLRDVVFAGFVNQSELPEIYAASDVFVLPSEDEPWGLAVNEVMCAGLPLVVSEEAGCHRDLVREGVNGFSVRPGDVLSLVSALNALLGDEGQRRRMGQASLSIIEGWSYEQCRQGLAAALTHVVPSQ
jgi:glycosyltransferase involved in cell wall biosynthesis